MRIDFAVVFVFSVLVAVDCIAGEIVSLDALSNDWGRVSALDFRRSVYDAIPAAYDSGGATEVERWCLKLVTYPDLLEETGTTYWMDAKVSSLAYCVRMKFVNASSNCWFAAADLLKRYRAITRQAESNACLTVDIAAFVRTDPGRANRILNENHVSKVRAWNLKAVDPPLSFLVTNEFAKSILPPLPNAERTAMLSNILVRAGLSETK